MFILVLGSVVVIGSILMTVFCLSIFLMNDDSSKYDVTRDYDVAGTIIESDIEYRCVGTGTSTPLKEAGNEHIYRFSFTVNCSDSSRSFMFSLFCDSKGVPLSDMYHKTVDEHGDTVWTFEDDGIVYSFPVGDYCKVAWVDIDGEGVHLRAESKE